ncbi:MlaA family lipoprotein [Thiovibrio frasassiensis]|uniref:VacJ family lipoprotein n=1 Tax=Thiovibrio frasassiensis TaxID=2984131 RepID=A0A9X4MHB5_9BACT|nr:VacJ family lipoprotein [Thiovibrio frasassiensis]MDG4476388.1 VacJ family lipoprotein [Thiovibrio frasassiensis]
MALGQEFTLDDESALGNGQDIALASDPLEPMNRVFFHFNDKLYFWVLKPASQGYAYILAEDVRMCVRSFFKNLLAPVRIVNNLLQGKVADSGVETARFILNSTLGIAGLADTAKNEFGLSPKDEDLGQTMGVYGIGEGIYICWPVFGPSNVRDTLGLAGDFFLSPISYLAMSDTGAGVAVNTGREVNNTSLTIGDYEDFKESAIDPYIALRDAYRQYRNKKISDIAVGGDSVYISSLAKTEKTYVQVMPGPIESDVESVPVASDDFFVQVGTSVDAEQVLAMRQTLLAMNEEPVVTVYDRGDYNFYALQVPAGKKFEFAKQEEQKLCAVGFSEARVVQ